MKQNEVEMVISLKKAFLYPKTKRVRKAINEIKAFVLKNEKNSNPSISPEVSELLTKNSKNIPRKINAILVREEKNVRVYLKDSKQLEQDKKKKQEEKKGKEKKEKKDKEEKDSKQDADQKQKLEEKKQKEAAAKSAEMKKGRK